MMRKNLLTRRAFARMRELGLRRRDFTPEERFEALLAYGAGLDLHALQKFLETPHVWKSAVAREKRSELIQLREYVAKVYEAGDIELALMTARLIRCEAQHIGMRVSVDPVMRQNVGRQDGLIVAREKSAAKRRKITQAAYDKAKELSNGRRKDLARKLGVSLQAVRDFEKKNKIAKLST